MATASHQAQPIKCRVNRAFWKDGQSCPVGAEISLPPALASELYGAGKVERADHEPSDAHKQFLADAQAKAERKKRGPEPNNDGMAKQLALLTQAVAKLTEMAKARA